MKFKTYGKKSNPVVILVHGEHTSTWSYEEHAQILSENFFVVLPQWMENFLSIEDSAQRIMDYLKALKPSKIALIVGTEMGGQIVLQLVSANPFICSDCVLESVPLESKQKKYFIFNLLFLFTKLPFVIRMNACRLHIPADKYDDFCETQKNRNYTDYKNMMKAKDEFRLPSLYRVQAQTLILVGEYEGKKARKDAQKLYRAMIDSHLEFTKTKAAGEFSLTQPQYFSVRLMKLYNSIF